jgi:hypothetical protein
MGCVNRRRIYFLNSDGRVPRMPADTFLLFAECMSLVRAEVPRSCHVVDLVKLRLRFGFHWGKEKTRIGFLFTDSEGFCDRSEGNPCVRIVGGK